METKTKIYSGIIGTVLLLITLGGTIYLTQDELAIAYVCSTNENLGFFDRLSSTSKTGYYTDEAGVAKSKACTNGQWVRLEQYAKDKGIDPTVFLQKNNIVPSEPITEAVISSCQSNQYICNSQGCVKKCEN